MGPIPYRTGAGKKKHSGCPSGGKGKINSYNKRGGVGNRSKTNRETGGLKSIIRAVFGASFRRSCLGAGKGGGGAAIKGIKRRGGNTGGLNPDLSYGQTGRGNQSGRGERGRSARGEKQCNTGTGGTVTIQKEKRAEKGLRLVRKGSKGKHQSG